MKLSKLFSGAEPAEDPVGESENWVEVNVMDSAEKRGKIGIKVEKINEFSDTDRVLKELRKGNVVFVKIAGLRNKDMGELKRAVEKLKKTAVANNGDIAGVEQDWLILTPEYAAVERF